MYQLYFSNSSQAVSQDAVDNSVNLRFRLVNLFEKRRRIGIIKKILAFLLRSNSDLLDLNKVISHSSVSGSRYLGIRSISIDQIKGSESRSKDFDDSFNPIHERSRSRWLSVAKARLAGLVLQPVQITQVGEIYFVRDGHHRISVARALGEKFIDAEITKLDVQAGDAAG
jgi:hypothetical protein